MKIYLTQFVTGLSILWILLLYLGFSAGFENYFPILALFGSIVILLLSNPLTLYKPNLGAKISLISSIIILPYLIGFTNGIFNDFINGSSLIVFLFAIPILFILLTLYFNFKILSDKNYSRVRIEAISFKVKIVLVLFPLILALMYVLVYGKYWNWQMFNV